jgi:hypothetical protein
MFDPIPELSDDTLIEIVRFPAILRNALTSAGLKTIGDIRARSDGELRRMTRIGPGRLLFLRKTLGSGPNDPPPLIQKRKLTPRDRIGARRV